MDPSQPPSWPTQVAQAPPGAPTHHSPSLPPGGPSPKARTRLLWAIAAVSVVLVGLAVAVVTSGGDDDDDGQTARADTTAPTAGSPTTAGEGSGAPATPGDGSEPASPFPEGEPEVVVSHAKVVEPPPSCPDLVTADQVAAAVGTGASFGAVNDQQPCMFAAMGNAREGGTVIVATVSGYGGLASVGIEDPSASTGPAEYEGNTRYEFLDADGICSVFLAVSDDGVAPYFLNVAVGAMDNPDLDSCGAADTLLQEVFAALPDA